MQNCIFNMELVKIHNCISKEKLQIHFITDYIELEKCCNCIYKKDYKYTFILMILNCNTEMRMINSGREGLLGRGLTWDLAIEKMSLVHNFIVNMVLI